MAENLLGSLKWLVHSIFLLTVHAYSGLRNKSIEIAIIGIETAWLKKKVLNKCRINFLSDILFTILKDQRFIQFALLNENWSAMEAITPLIEGGQYDVCLLQTVVLLGHGACTHEKIDNKI